ncbi:T9SS type A sorting domain-containing protein, partial [Bacteroidota bacterium]
PEAYTSRLKSGQEAGAKFNFIIENAPSSLVPAALEKAGEIWGSLIYSPVPITVKVEFADQDEGVLASTGIPYPPYVLDDNGYLGKRIYVQAMSEKLLQRNLNSYDADMSMTYNKNVSWYFKTDGETTEGRYDFLTTVLHEMAHGLGFFGFFSVDEDGIGRGANLPGAFDGFFENDMGERLTDTTIFPTPSKKLGEGLTTAPVRFISPVITRELPSEAPGPKMHIPPTWASGNSLYHLEYRYSTVNHGRDALMTYAANPEEALHDPGPLATQMLYEIGWVHTYIIHDTLKDRENIDQPFTVDASIYGDKGILDSTQYLFYSFDNFLSVDSLLMSSGDTLNEYTADIPVTSIGTGVNYYIQSRDTFGRLYRMPSTAPSGSYQFSVEPDETPPSIQHIPIQFVLTTKDTVEIKANIWDNMGLITTQVEYSINGLDQPMIDLELDTLIEYRGNFIFGPGQLKAGDVIKYRIMAIDASVSQHLTTHPATGYHEFRAEDTPDFVDSYSNDFEDGIDDFLVDRFYHSKPIGFSSYGLHTDHPYPSPNADHGSDEVFAQLKVPIHLHEGKLQLSYDEIAYIEDGEANATFPDQNFYDFVIVEGSKDGGNNWKPFIKGYDCRFAKIWFDEFTHVLKQDNTNYLSLAVPDESAIRQHRVNLFSSEHFSEGDVVLIRFRLDIDPYYSGWGWMIDNMEIKPLITGREDIAMVSETIELYPNPTTGSLSVSMQLIKEPDELGITLLDMVGRQVFTESYTSVGLRFDRQLDLGELPNGVYIMMFTSGQQSLMKKVILAR